MGKIAIVGNGSVGPENLAHAERHEMIIRFNAPPEAHAAAGGKTDVLYLSNSSKQTQSILTDRTFLEGPFFTSTQTIMMPYAGSIVSRYMKKPNILSRLKGRKPDYSKDIASVATAFGKMTDTLTDEAYMYAAGLLGIAGDDLKQFFPSSGFLATLHTISQTGADDWPVNLFGFGFSGWKRHKWAEEKAVVESLQDEGKLVLNAVT